MLDNLIELLRELAVDLDDPHPERSVLSEIRDLLDDQVVPRLVEAMTHDDPLIRKTAAVALGSLGWPRDGSLDVEAAVPKLREVLNGDPDPTVRMESAEALWQICEHEAAVQAFFDALHKDVEFRRWGAMMLGVVGDEAPEAVQPLTDALDDVDLLVRRYAAEALATHGVGAASALPKLHRLLGEDERTRFLAVKAMLTIDASQTEELCPVLVEALASRSLLTRLQAADALGDIPTAGRIAVPHLIKLLDDDDIVVRLAAMNSLEKLGSAAAPAVEAIVKILRGEGKDEDDILVRGSAADVLSAIGEQAQAAVFFLLECLQEPGGDKVLPDVEGFGSGGLGLGTTGRACRTSTSTAVLLFSPVLTSGVLSQVSDSTFTLAEQPTVAAKSPRSTKRADFDMVFSPNRLPFACQHRRWHRRG
jgi:HEAT repeat protein